MEKILNTVQLGDCLEIMRQIPDESVNLILCDLPYQVTSLGWDTIIPFQPLWEQYKRIGTDNCCYCLFGVQPFTTDLINSNREMFKYSLVWNKNVPTGMAQAKYRPMRYHEDILIFYNSQPTYNPIKKERVGVGKACYNYDHYCGPNNHLELEKVKKKYDPDFVNPSTVLDFKVVPNRNGKLHPTQKPVDLCEYLIRTYTNEGDTVLDNAAGSGTTLIAAKKCGRQFIGIEKDPEFYQIVQNRLNNPENV